MGKTTKTMRVSAKAYSEFSKFRELYVKHHGGDRATYGHVVSELVKFATLVLEQREVYLVGDRFFNDKAEAWGAACQRAVADLKAGREPKGPMVYYFLGEDREFKFG